VLGLLFAHNFLRVPYNLGMDWDGHLQYVEFLLTYRTLPFGNQGWQLFQPPLAYLLAAGAAGVAGALGLSMALGPRGLTVLVGLAAVWFGCRTAELVFRDRPATALVAMTLTAALPAVIYSSQAFGNEPYFACLGAMLLHRMVASPEDRHFERHATLLGAIGGLALLAKTSALILVVVVAAVLWHQARAAAHDRRAAARAVAIYLGFVALVGGWWYLRNVLALGRPFVGGWEVGRGLDWWQHPGYRLWSHLLSFGEVLAHPVYAAVVGFWDGIYSTLWGDGFLSGSFSRAGAADWNYTAMSALYLLALPVTLAIAVGCVRALAAPPPGRALVPASAALLILYLGAAFHLYAGLPVYSAAKGTYLMALAPCLGILAAWGLEPLLRRRAGQAAVAGYLGAWTLCVLLAFWIRSG
jgi:hypothetical protein